MSFFGFDGFKADLDRIGKAMALEVSAANRDNAMLMQRFVVARVPVDTGATRDAFASPDAVAQVALVGGVKGWRFGLLTPALKKKGYKALWLEFGTKGYDAGSKRASRRGGKSKQRVGRHIPARAARPFFRPGIEAARRELLLRYTAAVARAITLPGRGTPAAGIQLARHQYARDVPKED